MNIVVLGGGTPGKFGNDFVKKARANGHRVIVLSHRDHNTGNTDDRVIDYNNTENTKSIVQQITIDMPSIDLILFNQNGAGYPDTVDQLFSEPVVSRYSQTMTAHVILPHLIISVLYNNLTEGSKVVFMNSSMAFEYERNHFGAGVGYPAGKSFATHLMTSMARSRTKKVTFSAVCPFFIYNDPVLYGQALTNLYDHIINHDDKFNGKIVAQLKGFENPPSEISIKYV